MLFLLRMDTTALHFFLFLHIPFHRTTIFSIGVNASGPDWACSAMHSPFLLSRGHQFHTAEPLVLSTLSCPPQRMVDPRSTIGGRQYRDIRERRQASRRRLLSIGSMTET